MKKVLALILSFAMAFSVLPANAFASEADPSSVAYEFGSSKTQLTPGKYELPVSLNKAGKENDSSMAGSCIKGATLLVGEDGTGTVTIDMGPVSVGAMTGWGSEWSIYPELANYKEWTETSRLEACEFTTNAEGEADSITFTVPNNTWDGTYTHMYIGIMGLYQDAYFKMDYANAIPYVEPVPVNFSAGNNGTLVATVNNREINSGDLVEVGQDVVFTAQPNTGYAVEAWSGIEGSGDTVTVTVAQALDVQVTFVEKTAQKYAVVFNAKGHGTLSATVNGQAINSGDMVEENSSVIFTAVPEEGYATEWNGVSGDGNTATAVVTKALNVSANFKQILDRTKLDEAIQAADAIVANKVDYANDANWAKFETKLKYAKEHKFDSQDLVDGTAELLAMYQEKLTKLDKTGLTEAYNKISPMKDEIQKGYPLDIAIQVQKPWSEAFDYVELSDAKRAKDQKEIDNLTANINSGIKAFEDYQAKNIDIASVKKADDTVTNYKSLGAALDAAAEEDTVILLGDLTTAAILNGAKNLDLNGFTLTNKDYKKDDLWLQSTTHVLPKNGTLNVDELFIEKEITLGKGLTINGLISSNAKITVDGAVLNALKGSDLFGFDQYSYTLPEIVVNSGTLNAPEGYAINQYIGNGGVITKITINGGTLIGKEYAIKGTENITVNGGKFKAEFGAILGGKVITPEGKKLSTVADKDGFFKLIDSTVDEGTEMVISVDGKKYATAEEAFKNVTEGAKVKLLADVEVTDYVEIAKSCTIDLNGHRLRIHPFNHSNSHAMGNGGVWCAVKVLEGVKVDIVDKSILKKGVLAQTGASRNDSGIIVLGELTATNIKCDNQNSDGFGSLIIANKTGKAKVTLDNVKLADTNKSVIVSGGNESGDIVIKNITETFDDQYDTIVASRTIGRSTYTIENCNFTDAGEKRSFPDNFILRNTVWNFTNGGSLEAQCYEQNREMLFENATIITNNPKEAVRVEMHDKAVFKNCNIKNAGGYAINFENYYYRHYTIESGIYEGKDYAIKAAPVCYVTGGKFKGAKAPVNGIAGCPKGKELKLAYDGYYTLQDGEGFKFESANGKDVAVYAKNGELLGGADLNSDDILMAPNHAKLVLQKDVNVTEFVKLTMLYGGKLTFDLNGHTIAIKNGSSAIKVSNGTGVTIVDSKDSGWIKFPTDNPRAVGKQLFVSGDEGTYLNIEGGNWDVILLINGSVGKMNISGGHFNIAGPASKLGYKEPMLLANSKGVKVTGGDFNYDVSKEMKGFAGFKPGTYQPIFDTVCDPVPHDTHYAEEVEGRWYVKEKPAPEAPVITPESKKFTKGETVEVTITETDPEAKVYYTLDGKKPTSKSTEYTAPFTVDKTTTVTAVAIRGSKVSPFAEATYTMLTPEVKKGQADVSFGGKKSYGVDAEVTILDGKISDVVLNHSAKEDGHESSVSYADAAKAMNEKFKGLAVDDKAGIEGLDAVSGATVTSDAYKEAVLKALGLYKPADLTFGSGNKELKPGVYNVPISLRHAVKHQNPSAAVTAFPATATLTVAKDGTATLETTLNPVKKAGLVDMAQNIKVYQEDNFNSATKEVTILESLTNPEGIYNPNPGTDKVVPSKISFQIPNNDWDGVYLSLWVDAMNDAPDAWLQIGYDKALAPGTEQHFKGSAKVDQFGKYTIYTDITVVDGKITNVDVTAGDFISETHRPENEMKIDQVTKALKENWNGMAPTQENAEAIFRKIYKDDTSHDVIDSVSGATYSAKAVRDAVMGAFKLDYQDEIINVPENVEPGIYEVEIEYASDVVWHSLVENEKTKAILTVNADKTMNLEFDTKSGTDKEPLYILGFNGVYPNNDRKEKLTLDGCSFEMGLSSNDYEDEFFAKGTQVVNHVKFPLLGGLQKVYNTNAYLYVPAMKRLNGELSGVNFKDGHFNVDIFAKIFWDGMKKIGDVPTNPDPDKPVEPETTVKAGTVDVSMLHQYKDELSMCDSLFAPQADVVVNGDTATLKVKVAYPIPAFPEEGKDGTIKNFVIHYDGADYTAESDITTKSTFTAKADNQLFGLKKGQELEAQILTFQLPAKAIEEAELPASAFVNAVMGADVEFRIALSNLQLKEVENPNPDKPDPEVKPDPEKPDPEVKPEPEKPAPEVKPELDIRNLKDGVYMIDGSMVKTDKNTPSMADKGINHKIKLTVKGGKYYLTLDFKGIEIGDKFGYLGNLKYFLSGYGEDANGNPIGDLADVTVDSIQMNENGQKIEDQYGTDYPDKVTFEMIPEALENGLVPLQVFVPIMDSISAGSGTQPVYLKLAWNTIKEADENDPAFSDDGKGSTSGKPGTGIGTTKPGMKPAVKTGDVAQNNVLWATLLLLGAVMALAAFSSYKRRKTN